MERFFRLFVATLLCAIEFTGSGQAQEVLPLNQIGDFEIQGTMRQFDVAAIDTLDFHKVSGITYTHITTTDFSGRVWRSNALGDLLERGAAHARIIVS